MEASDRPKPRLGTRKALLPFLCSIALIAAAAFLLAAATTSSTRSATGSGAPAAGTSRGATPSSSQPAPSTRSLPRKYLTLNKGDTVDLSPGPVSFEGHPALVKRIGVTWKFKADAPGHTVITVGAGAKKRQVYLFVSPLPSRHVTREDIDWYRSQYGTGLANCGPADIAMAIIWARGKDVSVQQIRDEIGWPYQDGSLSFKELSRALDRHRVRYRTVSVSTTKDLVRVLNRGHLALLLVQTGAIDKAEGDPVENLAGKYYDDDQGHYILVKGYSLDSRYFVVYDPYPVDWEENSLRYGDEVSMIGKNRYYASAQVVAALKTPTVLEIQSD